MGVCSRLSQMLLILSCKVGVPVACFLHSSSSCKINFNENGYVRKMHSKFLQTKILYLYLLKPGMSVIFCTHRNISPSVCMCVPGWRTVAAVIHVSHSPLLKSQSHVFCQILLILKMYSFALYTMKFQPVSAPPVPRQPKSPLVVLCSPCMLIRTGMSEALPVLCKPGPGSLSIWTFLQ